jgi:hypothetical protein
MIKCLRNIVGCIPTLINKHEGNESLCGFVCGMCNCVV